MYQIIQTKDLHVLFDFDSKVKMASLQKLIGEMSVVVV